MRAMVGGGSAFNLLYLHPSLTPLHTVLLAPIAIADSQNTIRVAAALAASLGLASVVGVAGAYYYNVSADPAGLMKTQIDADGDVFYDCVETVGEDGEVFYDAVATTPELAAEVITGTVSSAGEAAGLAAYQALMLLNQGAVGVAALAQSPLIASVMSYIPGGTAVLNSVASTATGVSNTIATVAEVAEDVTEGAEAGATAGEVLTDIAIAVMAVFGL